MAGTGYPLGNAAGSDIPLEHFDDKYITACKNVDELEQIIRILRSGVEGKFPHLEEMAEKRLHELDPNSIALIPERQAQSSRGTESTDVKEFLTELENWKGSQGDPHGHHVFNGSIPEGSLPPVRAANVVIGKASQGTAASVSAKSKQSSKQDLSPAEAAGAAEQDRQKGNEAFRSGDYVEAIDYYSRSIDSSPCLQAHTNRALAYLKKKMYAKALEDCNQALKIAPADPKGLYRKACALEGLGELVEAKSCLKSVLVSEPSNKKANELLLSVEKKMSQKKKQKKGKKVVIQEVDGDQGKKDGVSSGQADTSQGKDTTSGTTDKSGNTPGSETFSEPKPENQKTSKDMQQSEKRATPTDTLVDGSKRESEASSTERTPVVEPPVPEGVERLRQEGNDYYKKGQYSESVRMYTSSLDMLDPAGSPSHAAVYCSVLANRAAGWLKVGDCRRCIGDASTVLGLQPGNLRARSRRAEAYELMEKYPEALGDYEALVRMAPGVDNIRNAASRIRSILSALHGPKWRSLIPQSNASTGTLAASGSDILKTSGPQTSDVSTKVKAQTTTSDLSTKGSQPSPVLQTPPVSNSESSPLTGSPPSSVPVPECRHEPQTDQPSRLESGKTSETQTVKTSQSKESGPSPPLSQVQEATDSGTNQTSDAQSKLSSETKAQQTSSSAAARESNKPAQTVFEEFRLKGNALVKSGDYERALHCYSQCIKASPATSIGYTNRALCFLKLNRPGLAEEDCSIVLEVDSANVKALYRRALARKALRRYSHAAKDLHELLKIDSKNTAAQSEIDAVKELWRKDLQSSSSPMEDSSASKKASKKRNKAKKKKIAIEEVVSNEPSSPSVLTTGVGSPVDISAASRGQDPLKLSSEGGVGSGNSGTVETSPQSGQGGFPSLIGNSEPQSKSSESQSSSSQPKGSSTISQLPSDEVETSNEWFAMESTGEVTAYMFQHAWNSIPRQSPAATYASLLHRIKPQQLPQFVSNTLDGEMLTNIVSASEELLDKGFQQVAYDILLNTSKCPRFSTVAMFLSKREREACRRIIDALKDTGKARSDKLAAVYGAN